MYDFLWLYLQSIIAVHSLDQQSSAFDSDTESVNIKASID